MDISNLLNYGGFAIGIIGIFLSIYLYRKGLEKKEPRYFYRTYREIEKLSPKGDSDIQILYKSKNVDRVFTSYLWLWNKGKKAIHETDIPPQSKLTIKLVDKKYHPNILDYRVLKTSRDETNFRINTVTDNEFSIAFDFLDYNDGAVIEIQHTGSYDTGIETDGIILGVPNGIVTASKQSSNSFLESFRSILSRGRMRRSTRLFVHKSFRQKFMSVFLYLIMFVLVVGLMGSIVYGLNAQPTANPIVSIKSDRLKEILVSEAPQLTNENIQNIIARARERAPYERFFIYFLFAYLALIIWLAVLGIWQEFMGPVPKSLYLQDDIEKNQK